MVIKRKKKEPTIKDTKAIFGLLLIFSIFWMDLEHGLVWAVGYALMLILMLYLWRDK